MKWNFGLFLFMVCQINCILTQSMKDNELSDAKVEINRNRKIPDGILIYGEIIPHLPTRAYQNKKQRETTYYTDSTPHNHITASLLQSFNPSQTTLLSTSPNAVSLDKQKILPTDAVAEFVFSFTPTERDESEDDLNDTKQESSSEEDLSTAETEIVVSFQPTQQGNSPDLQQPHSQTSQHVQNISIGQTLSQAMSATNKPTIQHKGNIANSQHHIRRGGVESTQTSAVATPIPVAQIAPVAHSAPTHAAGAPSFQISFDPISLILGLLQAIPIPSLNLGGKAFFGVQFNKGLNFGSGADAAAAAPVLQQAYAQRRQQPRLSTVFRLG